MADQRFMAAGWSIDAYDWCDSHSTHTPERFPYSHSDFYVWRDFNKKHPPKGMERAYTDRMRGWDADKHLKATEGKMTNWGSVPRDKKAAKEIVKDYFGKEYVCIGVIQSMNVSNGNPLGAFLFIKQEADNG